MDVALFSFFLFFFQLAVQTIIGTSGRGLRNASESQPRSLKRAQGSLTLSEEIFVEGYADPDCTDA